MSPEQDINYSLLDNRLDYLESAVERLQQQDGQRALKFAILDLVAGLELVMKERLRIHDPALLYADPRRFYASDFEAGSFFSANWPDTLKRLDEEAGVAISSADQDRLKILRVQRNRAQHFAFKSSAEAVQAALAHGLGFGLQFIGAGFDGQTLDQSASASIERIRIALPELDQFVIRRWSEIQAEIAATSTAVTTCPACTEDALVLDAGAHCLFCGYRAEPEEGANHYAHAVIGESRYVLVKEGQPWVVAHCPNCEMETLVDQGPGASQSPRVRWLCFACGEQWTEQGLQSCARCGEWTSNEDGDMTVCSNCFDYVVNGGD